jgi:cation transporter-like permease
MVIGPVLAIVAYFMSHGTSSALEQRDAVIIALIGISLAVVGSAVFLRYSLTDFLRFWLARQAFDLNNLTSQLSPTEKILVSKDVHDDSAKHAVAPR